jgi:hypothetical protein
MTDPRTQIQQLKEKLADLSEDLASLEKLLGVDVPSSLNKIRFITEKVLHTMCIRRGVTWGEAEPTLERMIGPLTSEGVIPKNIATLVRTIQTNTSPGSHYQEHALSQTHVTIAQTALVEFLEWYFSTFEVGPAGDPAGPMHRLPSTAEVVPAIQGRHGRRKKALLLGAAGFLVGVVIIIGLTAVFHSGTAEDRHQNVPAVAIDVHPDGRPLRRDFGIQVEIVGGVQDPSGLVTLAEGDLVTIRVAVDQEAYVGVWGVEEQGSIVMLFPNKKEADHRVPAHQARTIPRDPGWSFRAKPSKGSEYILVFASTKEWAPSPALRGVGQDEMYPVYVTPQEQKEFHDNLRGLELVENQPKDGATSLVAEAVVRLKVVAKK